MDPPSYNEAPHYPPAPTTAIATISSFPPHHPTPTTPPPTYGEAVTMQMDPFPVLTPPTRQSLPIQEQTSFFLHQSTQIVNMETVQQHFPTVLIIQPEAVGPLGDAPCMTQCSNCRQRVTTVVTYRPGMAAWAMCGLLTLLGCVCVCVCVIPFEVPGFQDAHHSCPLCHAHLHIHTR
ncbi:uncharacterized protein ACWYII_004776 [Salvelinus alpinus]